MMDKNYRSKRCKVCKNLFKPDHPRKMQCDKCRCAGCAICGKPTKAGEKLTRRLTNPERICGKCHRKYPLQRRRGREMVAQDGTRRVSRDGYVRVKLPNGQWVFEHRHIMATVVGRKLRRGEIVHHVDGNRSNNAPENLVLCKSVRHHLDTYHKGDLKKPPVHHNGRKKKGTKGWRSIK